MRHAGYMKQKEVSMGLNIYQETLYVTKEAREFLFDGYQDKLIDLAQEMKKYNNGKQAVNIPYDRFGWFYEVGSTDHQTNTFSTESL